MNQLLENIFWHCLSGPHARFAAGTGDARRYAPGFSPIVGFPDPARPNFAALAPHCEAGEHFYCDGWAGPAPEGWRIDAESTMFRMVWDAPIRDNDDAPDSVALGPEHAQQAFDLAMLTRPGSFGLRTIELGEYYGYFENGRLIAMGASGWRPKVSGRSAASARIPTTRAADWRAS